MRLERPWLTAVSCAEGLVKRLGDVEPRDDPRDVVEVEVAAGAKRVHNHLQSSCSALRKRRQEHVRRLHFHLCTELDGFWGEDSTHQIQQFGNRPCTCHRQLCHAGRIGSGPPGTAFKPSDLTHPVAAVVGDLVVRPASSTTSPRIEPTNVHVIGGVHHLDLLHEPPVIDAVAGWLSCGRSPDSTRR